MVLPTQWTLSLSKLWEVVRDSGVWHAAVHGATMSWTRFGDSTTKEHLT